MMTSAASREAWLSEQARSAKSGSDDQLSWLLTAATLYPSNLEANINLFRVLRSQNKANVAAILLTNLIAKFNSTEIVLAEMKSLADDADDERHCNLLAAAAGDEVEKIENAHKLACSIISKLPPDIQAVVRVKAVGTTGLLNLTKRTDILCNALGDSFHSGGSFSDAFVSLVCADLLERLLNSPSRELRRCLCDKVLPALFRTKFPDSTPHPVVSRLPHRLVLRCLHIHIGHVLLNSFNSSTASLVSIDRQWQPCLSLVNKVLFSFLNFTVPSVFSEDGGVDPQPAASPEQLTIHLANLQDRFVELKSEEMDTTCDILAIMTVLGLIRNVTAYLRAILYPSDGESFRPVLLPSLNVLENRFPDDEKLEIIWSGSEDDALTGSLSSAFNIWNYLHSISPSSSCIRLPRRVHEIIADISAYFEDEDPLKFMEQFRVDACIYKGAFDQALSFLEANRQSTLKSLLTQRILCVAAIGRVKDAARLILETNFAPPSPNSSSEMADELDLNEYSSTKCYLFVPVSSTMFTQMTVTILRKTFELFWPVKDASTIIIPSTLLLLSQVQNWPTHAQFSSEILNWLFLHVSVLGSTPTPAELLAAPRIQILLQTVQNCVFRPELLEFLLHRVASTVKESSSSELMETDQQSEVSLALSTATKTLQSQLSSVTVNALSDPNSFVLSFIRANVQQISAIIAK